MLEHLEAVARVPAAWPLPWEHRAAQSHPARPEEVHEPSWGTAQGWHLDRARTVSRNGNVTAM